jgi:hypothetical protein
MDGPFCTSGTSKPGHKNLQDFVTRENYEVRTEASDAMHFGKKLANIATNSLYQNSHSALSSLNLQIGAQTNRTDYQINQQESTVLAFVRTWELIQKRMDLSAVDLLRYRLSADENLTKGFVLR